ncbi:hypothetical protein MKJ01_00260 [Chryseobacterium sp. SSA4.19]|uniref:hypothetical protein n=1 Tax=Chryseobacterium sp. SSA4.19 TaxID=2919915 RepID=UPI001F4E2DBA|nr:hypothetical protein [Chryseobacterium sp. SSA4.19]MCJ8152192.1 hypothetical protein [Chryseobacterium sp. SSA4.19]
MLDSIQIFNTHHPFDQMVIRWINAQMKNKFNKDIQIDDCLSGISVNNHYVVMLQKKNSIVNDDEYFYAETLVKLLNDGLVNIEEIL